ncbi:MAG: lipase family alpha/beta hydrolase [Candidatus Hodarchaeota archaeon]
MSIKRAIYEIDTHQGLAGLNHQTLEARGSPVLMVHGFGSNADIWFAHKTSIGHFFKTQGLDCWTLDLSNAIAGNIEILAHEDLLTSVDFIYKKKQKKVVIVAHSMGGIIARVFTSPHFKHPYPLKRIEEMIKGIALLTVPNHGVEMGDISKIEETVNTIRKLMKPDQEPIESDFGLGFVQLTYKSHLIQTLNKPLVLNPNISWLNAIGTYDKVVPIKSARFSDSETNQLPKFVQKEFACDHMVYPLASTLQKVIKATSSLLDAPKLDSKFVIYPAIHRFQEVGEWIFTHLISK